MAMETVDGRSLQADS